MLRVLILSLMAATATSAPLSDDAQAKIIEYENTNDGIGNYHFSFRTSNGLTREETGELVNADQPDEHIAVQGLYTYIDPDGQTVIVHYTADKNGYQARGEPKYEIFTGPLPGAVVASLLG